jgi:uncharacterized protein (TIGR03083 family)
VTRLSPEEYLDHIVSESARFREVAGGCDPATRVPACPNWDVADLVWHLAGVQYFWSVIVDRRPITPDDLPEEPPRPASYDALLTAFDEASARLVGALGRAEPGEHAWHWGPDQTVGASHRRQAHEALIHRLDAEEAAGRVTALDARLAADGVHEALTMMYGGCPAWGTITPSERVVDLDLVDTGEVLHVALARFTGTDPASGTTHDEPDIAVVEQGAPLATVRGSAADLDAWLWHRGEGRVRIEVEGDRAAYAELVEVLRQPLTRTQRWTAPHRRAAAATAASRAAPVSASVSVRSGARNRSAKASDLRPWPTWAPV